MNNSFINNDEELGEEEEGGAIYRNEKIFEEERIKQEEAKKKKEKGLEEDDEDYKIKEEKDIKEEDNDNDNEEKLEESDYEIGEQYAKTKKKKRLRKKKTEKEKFKRELDNLQDDYQEGSDVNRSMDNSENDIRENIEEDSQTSNKYRRNKGRRTYNEGVGNFIEYSRERKELYPEEKKREVGIEQLEQYISEEDKNIVGADYPERLITRYKIEDLKSLSQEIKEEVDWICEQKNYLDFPNKKKKINTLLELYKKDFLDIPYIINYRYYLFEHDFQKNELWEIFEFDAQYQKFIELKKKVMNNFNTLEPYLNEKIFHNMKEKCIDNAKSMQELNKSR